MTPYKLGVGLIEGRAVPIALVGATVFTLEEILGSDSPAGLMEVFADWARFDRLIEARGAIAAGGRAPDTIEFLSPVANPRKVICIGANYRDHLAEMKVTTLPKYPYSFLRPPTSLAAHGEEIRLPVGPELVDWEAELGIVIGRQVGPDDQGDAGTAIAGYTVVNDVSARDWIATRPPVGIDWVMQKAWNRFQPTGPWITPARFVEQPQALAIELTVNGVVKQKSSTSEMIFGVREIVAHLSSIMTLEPGDLIATGTPAGVGFGRNPPERIRPGDRVRVTIGDLGVLENTFV